MHRREWYCNFCDRAFCARLDIHDHICGHHPDHFVPAQLQTLIDRCERPIEAEQQCPFCGENFFPGRLERHLAWHMQQISLFVPGPYNGEGVDDIRSNGVCADEEIQVSDGRSNLEFNSNPSDTKRSDLERSELWLESNLSTDRQDAEPLPPQQQFTMVMPDQIRWMYRDPSGIDQGPFNGLEMHEWYRAGFFTPELPVKRQQDTRYEQLGNVVRKIGDSREPFLVPLPYVANMSVDDIHHQQATPTSDSFRPPFKGSFPTFGMTSTAEQQNALQRRIQEEKYLMTKQREYLLQQQMMAKQDAIAQQLVGERSTKSLRHPPKWERSYSISGVNPNTAPTVSTAANARPGRLDIPQPTPIQRPFSVGSRIGSHEQLDEVPVIMGRHALLGDDDEALPGFASLASPPSRPQSIPESIRGDTIGGKTLVNDIIQ